ncbi:MAG: hypothetical protein AVDCRST_MAG19-314, partial [uncultured Thermomicrobiales bacterium]
DASASFVWAKGSNRIADKSDRLNAAVR